MLVNFIRILCILLIFAELSTAFPSASSYELTTDEKLVHPHHHHHKHHIRHKHRRRSLTSEEDTTKSQRNKQIMLQKPYWPWP